MKGYLSKLFLKIMKEMLGCERVEQNIQIDHSHMLVEIPPKNAVSEVVGRIKARAASRLRRKF